MTRSDKGRRPRKPIEFFEGLPDHEFLFLFKNCIPENRTDLENLVAACLQVQNGTLRYKVIQFHTISTTWSGWRHKGNRSGTAG